MEDQRLSSAKVSLRLDLAVDDAFEAPKRFVTTFNLVVGPPLYLNSVAAWSFYLLLAEWTNHHGASRSA
jgi:hypothetical protein